MHDRNNTLRNENMRAWNIMKYKIINRLVQIPIYLSILLTVVCIVWSLFLTLLKIVLFEQLRSRDRGRVVGGAHSVLLQKIQTLKCKFQKFDSAVTQSDDVIINSKLEKDYTIYTEFSVLHIVIKFIFYIQFIHKCRRKY